MRSCGCSKMFSFFIKPSALWDNSLCPFNPWDKFVFSLRLVLLCSFRCVQATFWSVLFQLTPRTEMGREVLPYCCPFVPCVWAEKESSGLYRLILAATHLLQRLSSARLSSVIGRISSIHRFILRSACSFTFLIKTHKHNISHSHPNPFL